ncbi:MAG: NFYB/HAP3 family transcription factor subunit [Candidatus Marsarchaeota archaeon]|nr:NFYB/HAP3 family transcription factor subunit [Candidatus Marsarchaeota archaeon]
MSISCATVRKILKEAGAERINKEAAGLLHKHLNTIALSSAKKAVAFAKHAKRKTVEASDIKLAIKN